jgi:hypothetical protein
MRLAMHAFRSFAATTILVLSATASGAELFRNSYITFELPHGWDCKAVETEWVCRPREVETARRTIVVLTAKVRGPNDRMDFYEDYLGTPRPPTVRGDGRERPLSTVIYMRREQMAGREWVRARHYQSLLPRFYSEYFATIDGQLAILLTFSAHEDHFEELFPLATPLVASIAPIPLAMPNDPRDPE